MTIANRNTVIRRLLIGLWLGFLTPTVHAGIDITYIHNDALGSAVAGTDEQGNVKWRSQYAPYGEERLGERSAFGIRSGYTGHRDDPETGLTYMGARYYSPTIGRFMGVDPAGVNASDIYSFNRYAYANNSPYKYIDPDGAESVIATVTLPGYIVGTLEVGNDPTSGLPFVRIKVGFGVGGGVAFDPNGALPRADELENAAGRTNNIGVSAEASATVGRLNVGGSSELLKTRVQDGSGAIRSAVTDPSPKPDRPTVKMDGRKGARAALSANVLDISTTIPGVDLTSQFRENDDLAFQNSTN